MNKKILGVVGFIVVLFLALNWKSINNRIVKVGIGIMKSRIRQASVVSFHYGKIDSLYEKNPYSYFLFLKDGIGTDDKLSNFVCQQSVLCITCHALPDWLKESGTDTLHVPQSAFDFLVDENQRIRVYRITEVKHGGNDNSYQLQKVDF